jgi:hypothetical protein
VFWDACKLWFRIAFANGIVVFVSTLLDNMGLVVPVWLQPLAGAALAALLAWLRAKFGDVLILRVVGHK